MSNEHDAFDPSNPVTLILKAGRDYDAEWLTIRGRTVKDVADQAQLAAEEGHFATIGKAAAMFKGLTAAGRELSAAPAKSSKPAGKAKADKPTDEAQQEATEKAAESNAEQTPELIAYKVGFKRKDEFKKLAGMRNAVYQDKVWHLKGDTDADVIREVEAAGFERAEG